MKFDIILYIIILILSTAFIIIVNKYMRIHKHINEITDVLKEVLKVIITFICLVIMEIKLPNCRC